MFMRGTLTMAGLAITAFALAGCASGDPAETSPEPATESEPEAGTGSGGEEESSSATGGDGTLTLYSGRNEDLVGPLIEQFTADTGIEVEVRYGSTGEMAALLLEEGDRTPAEVFLSQDAGALGEVATAGLASTLPAEIVEAVPADFTSQDGSWVGVTGRARVITYDGEQLEESDVPDEIDGVKDAKWNGQVALAPGNASFLSFVTALRVLEGEEEADAWIEAVSANDPILTESNGDTLELVNAGTAQLGLINHYYWYAAASEVGEDNMRAQLKYLPGDPGGIVNVTGASVLTGAEGDPEALTFVEYLLSEDGQSYFVNETYEYPLVPGIKAPEGLPPLADLANEDLDLSDLESLEETQALMTKHGLL